MKEEFSIEKERLHLIARLAEMELDQAVVRKLHTLLFGVPTPRPKKESERSPTAIGFDELVDVLRQDQQNPSKGVPLAEFTRQMEQWR